MREIYQGKLVLVILFISLTLPGLYVPGRQFFDESVTCLGLYDDCDAAEPGKVFFDDEVDFPEWPSESLPEPACMELCDSAIV